MPITRSKARVRQRAKPARSRRSSGSRVECQRDPLAGWGFGGPSSSGTRSGLVPTPLLATMEDQGTPLRSSGNNTHRCSPHLRTLLITGPLGPYSHDITNYLLGLHPSYILAPPSTSPRLPHYYHPPHRRPAPAQSPFRRRRITFAFRSRHRIPFLPHRICRLYMYP
ncbi:hypothetical protein BC628DRAFT_1360902 [Trametes gibbosa]|nr:hypothetical protein BC628DRAFT_1360902 [Trametes gibbosa]